jgi:hypothetical protein
MSIRERHTKAQERADVFSSKNGSSEKTVTTEQKEHRRVINFRKIVFLILLLSGLASLGVVHGERNKDVNKALREAHQACERDYDDSAEILCDLTVEFERLKELTHKEHSTAMVSIAVQQNNKLILDEWEYFRLYEIEPQEVGKKIDEIISKMKSLYAESGLDVFGYAIYTQYIDEESPQAKTLLLVTQDYTASAGTDTKGQRTMLSWHRSSLDLYMPGVYPGNFPVSTIDSLHTMKGDKSKDGLRRVYPGYGGTIVLSRNQQSELINSNFKYLRPWEQELYLKWVLNQDSPPKS